MPQGPTPAHVNSGARWKALRVYRGIIGAILAASVLLLLAVPKAHGLLKRLRRLPP